MSGLLSSALSKFFKYGSEVIESVKQVSSLSSDEFATVTFTHFTNDEDGPSESVIAGVVFEDEESARVFMDALVELLTEVEGEDE
jgi:hypothetical protein